MKVEVVPYNKEDNLFVALIDGKETNHVFDSEGKALIYAGLYVSVDVNDASYLSRYMSKLIDGLKE